MVRRPAMVLAQWLGIALMVPGLLRVPLPQVDFHVIRHHHRAGETCPQHDHLLRWHPQAGEAEDEAVLHWHWFLPHCLDAALSGEHYGASPLLHAHDAEGFIECFWSPSPATPGDATGASGRFGPGSSLDLAWLPAPWVAPPPPRIADDRLTPRDDDETAAPLARLVRWNC